MPSILDYINLGVRDLIIFFFDNKKDTDISPNDILNDKLLSNLPKDLKLFIIMDRTILQSNLSFQYNYNNKTLCSTNKNIII